MRTSTAPSSASPIPIADFFSALVNDYLARGRASTTIDSLRWAFGKLAAQGGLETTADLDRAVRRLGEVSSPAEKTHAYYNRLSMLRSACKHAMRLGLIAAMPPFPPLPRAEFRGVRSPKDAPSPGEIARALDLMRTRSAEGWEYHLIYVLASVVHHAGLFKREALTLSWADCNLDRDPPSIRVRRREGMRWSKFGPNVPIPSPLVPILLAWREKADSPWVFPNPSRMNHWVCGQPGEQPLDWLKRACRESGIPDLTFDALVRSSPAYAAPGLEPGPGPSSPPFGVLPDATSRDEGRGHSGPPPPPPEPVPCRGRPGRRFRPTPVLTIEGATRLLAHLRRGSATWEGHRRFAFIAICLLEGLKRGEAQGLEVDKCDLASGAVAVAGRSMPHKLSPAGAGILAGWLARADRVASPWIFPGIRVIAPWNGGRITALDELQSAGRESGVGYTTFKALYQLWRRHGGRVELGDEFHSIRSPDPIFDGPCPRRPSPLPKAGTYRQYSIPRAYRLARQELESRSPPTPGAARPATAADFETLLMLGDSYRIAPIVLGVERAPLSRTEFNVVRALRMAGPVGLNEAELRRDSGCANPRRVLTRLVKEGPSFWGAITVRPGQGRRRNFRFAPPGEGLLFNIY